jgi:hypothetical protein
MRRLVLTGAAVSVVAGAAGGRAPTRDRPPPGFTGGFGEPTCQLCHSETRINEGSGRLSLAGVPEFYERNRTYALTVTVVHPGLAAAGFQLAVRHSDSGAQAGSLVAAPAEQARVEVTLANGIAYAHHARPGTTPAAPDTARWRLVWTAPASAGEVSIHAVANAANGDDSPLGDYVYTAADASRQLRPEKGPRR